MRTPRAACRPAYPGCPSAFPMSSVTSLSGPLLRACPQPSSLNNARLHLRCPSACEAAPQTCPLPRPAGPRPGQPGLLEASALLPGALPGVLRVPEPEGARPASRPRGAGTDKELGRGEVGVTSPGGCPALQRASPRASEAEPPGPPGGVSADRAATRGHSRQRRSAPLPPGAMKTTIIPETFRLGPQSTFAGT